MSPFFWWWLGFGVVGGVVVLLIVFDYHMTIRERRERMARDAQLKAALDQAARERDARRTAALAPFQRSPRPPLTRTPSGMPYRVTDDCDDTDALVIGAGIGALLGAGGESVAPAPEPPQGGGGGFDGGGASASFDSPSGGDSSTFGGDSSSGSVGSDP